MKVVARHRYAPLVCLDDGSIIDTEELEVVGNGDVSGDAWEMSPEMEIDSRWEEIARADAANLGVTERKIASGPRTFRAPSHVRDALAETGIDSGLVDGKGLTLDELGALVEDDAVTGPAEEWMFGILNKHEENPDAEEELSLYSAAEPELDYDEIDSAMDANSVAASAGPAPVIVGDVVRLFVPGDQLGGAREETPVQCTGTVTDVEPDQVTVQVTEAADGPLEEPVNVATEPTHVIVAAVEAPPGDFTKVVYLALIEEDDQKSVQDLVALVSTKAGAAGAFVYGDKGWEESQEVLTKLQAPAPPPIQQLEDWQTESIVAQIASTGELSDEAKAEPWEETPTDAVHAQPENPDGPQETVQASAFELAEGGVLWGPDNKTILSVILAAGEGGLDRNRGGAEKLRHYWEHGKGAAKIRWGTPGDWTRCRRLLSKYMGPRAAGYCQLRHHAVTGMWTGDRAHRG